MDAGDEPRPGNYDRAWNDPPLFSYNPLTKTGSSGNKLNKRISHPVSAGPPPLLTDGSVSLSSPRLPDAGAKVSELKSAPPLLPPPVASSSTMPSNSSSSEFRVHEIDDEARDKTLETFNNLLASLEDKLDARKQQDISKRLKTLEFKWKEGSLNNAVERGLVQLAEAVGESRLDDADKIQKKMMVDWPAICGTWLVGIKHLILEASKL